MSRISLAKLEYCWEILEDARSDKLKRYGGVHGELADILDPQIDLLIGLVLAMECILRNSGGPGVKVR